MIGHQGIVKWEHKYHGHVLSFAWRSQEFYIAKIWHLVCTAEWDGVGQRDVTGNQLDAKDSRMKREFFTLRETHRIPLGFLCIRVRDSYRTYSQMMSRFISHKTVVMMSNA